MLYVHVAGVYIVGRARYLTDDLKREIVGAPRGSVDIDLQGIIALYGHDGAAADGVTQILKKQRVRQ